MNELFPVFIKMHEIQTLIVGAGNVGLEKLNAVINSSPKANITLVAEKIDVESLDFIKNFSNVKFFQKSFEESDLAGIDLVILATNNNDLNAKIRTFAKSKNILINVADKPDLCDFYLGSVVSKGDLKIGISTNGKSPTMAKRLKEFLNEIIPEEINESLDLLNKVRLQVKGDFKEKVKVLNARTRDFLNDRAN